MENDRATKAFQQLTEALMKVDGLSSVRQRLDSTHVISDIAVLTRLGLFTETVTHFLRELRKEAPVKLPKFKDGIVGRYLDREGYFADATREQAPRRPSSLEAGVSPVGSGHAARDEQRGRCPRPNSLIEHRLDGHRRRRPLVISGQKGVSTVASVWPFIPSGGPARRSWVGALGGLRPQRAPRRLQSPHDPDATYGHKGKGYEVQLVETCVAENPYQVVTVVAINGANVSDQHATVPIVEELVERKLAPEVLILDTAYGSGETLAACAHMGVAPSTTSSGRA